MEYVIKVPLAQANLSRPSDNASEYGRINMGKNAADNSALERFFQFEYDFGTGQGLATADDIRVGEAKFSWPRTCEYFDADIMDLKRIHWLLQHDTTTLHHPLNRRVIVVEGTDRVLTVRKVKPKAGQIDQILPNRSDSNSSTACLQIFAVWTKRLYDATSSVNTIDLDIDTWHGLLHHLEVLPSYLELVHDNQGGQFMVPSPTLQDSTALKGGTKAVHLCMRIGSWLGREYSLYARHDYRTGSNIILLNGRDVEAYTKRLEHRVSDGMEFSTFHILVDLLKTWLHFVDYTRQLLDSETRKLEGRTGHSVRHSHEHPDHSREKLSFSKDLQIQRDRLSLLSTGSNRVHEAVEFVLESLRYLHILDKVAAKDYPAFNLNPQSKATLEQALTQLLVISRGHRQEIESLTLRTHSQVDVIKTLVAEAENQISMELNTSMKGDSEIMRGIAAVTMIFLPATFVATFFSMSFFHVGDERQVNLVIDSKVWLYPLVTVPFTVVVIAWYFRRIGFNTRPIKTNSRETSI